MDLNSLYQGALKVAEMTKFPKEKVCLISEHKAEGIYAGVGFCEAGLFIGINSNNNIEVVVAMGTAAWIQPLDRMCGEYTNPRMALAAAGMIIAGCDLMDSLDSVLSATTHDNSFPARRTTVTVVNESFGD